MLTAAMDLALGCAEQKSPFQGLTTPEILPCILRMVDHHTISQVDMSTTTTLDHPQIPIPIQSVFSL